MLVGSERCATCVAAVSESHSGGRVERERHKAREQEKERESAKGESERRRAHARERGSERNGEREGVALRIPKGPLLGHSHGPNCRMIFREKNLPRAP